MGHHLLFPCLPVPVLQVQSIWVKADAAYCLTLVPIGRCAFLTPGTCQFRLVFIGPPLEFKKSGLYILHSSSLKQCPTLPQWKHFPENTSEACATLTATSISPAEMEASSSEASYDLPLSLSLVWGGITSSGSGSPSGASTTIHTVGLTGRLVFLQYLKCMVAFGFETFFASSKFISASFSTANLTSCQ